MLLYADVFNPSNIAKYLSNYDSLSVLSWILRSKETAYEKEKKAVQNISQKNAFILAHFIC